MKISFTLLFLAGTFLFFGSANAHDLQGLIDTSGKVVIPIKYQKIEYLDKGIYRCFPTYWQFERKPRGVIETKSKGATFERYRPEFGFAELLDKNGRTVDFTPPAGTVITAIHVPRELVNPLSGNKVKPNVFFTIHGSEGYGLVDWTGKVVVPAEYESISLNPVIYCKSWRCAVVGKKQKWGTQIPLETAVDENTGVDTQSKYTNPNAGYEVSNEGEQTYLSYNQKLLFKFPAGYRAFTLLNASRILLSPSLTERSPKYSQIIVDVEGNTVNKLPERSRVIKTTSTTVIVDQSPKQPPYGVGRQLHFIDFDGNVCKTILLKDMSVPDFKLGMAVLAERQTYMSILDNECEHSLLREDGTTLLPPQYCNFEITESDRVIKTVFQSKFDSEECKADEKSLGSQFGLLLQDFDLIGMPRSKLEELVGKPTYSGDRNASLYQLSGFGAFCGNANSFAEFRFANECVTGWRYTDNGAPIDPDHEKPWIEQNMLAPHGYLNRLIPKPRESATPSSQHLPAKAVSSVRWESPHSKGASFQICCQDGAREIPT